MTKTVVIEVSQRVGEGVSPTKRDNDLSLLSRSPKNIVDASVYATLVHRD